MIGRPGDETFDWQTTWSYLWELYADDWPDGTVSFDGFIDGWEPMGSPS